MRKLLYLVIFLMFAACGGNGRNETVLRRAQHIINDAPDSALTLLDSLSDARKSMDESTRMKWVLLRTMAQNKCDTIFRNDSVQLQLVNYFDRHGSANERMLVHYLLGRAYSDMGEAPLALRAYQDALTCADTTASDCDWWNLSRVMMQICYLYYYQNMPKEELELLNKTFPVAMKAGDTITAIMCREKRAEVYELLGKEDSVAVTGLLASMMYDEMGRGDLAAQTLSLVIPYQISSGDYQGAEKNMRRYEQESGFFDTRGNIVKGREYYYCLKGRFFLGVGKTDSAFHFFDKVIRECSNCDNLHAACRGMMEYYKRMGIPDSVVKYAMMSEQFNDSSYARTYTEELQRMKNMYDFTRQMEKTHRQEAAIAKQHQTNSFLVILAVMLITGLSLMFWYARKEKARAEAEKEKTATDLRNLQNEMRGLMTEKNTALADLKKQESLMEMMMNAHVLLQETVGQIDKTNAISPKGQEIISLFEAITKENVELKESLKEKALKMGEIVRLKNAEIDQLVEKMSMYDQTKKGEETHQRLVDSEIYQRFSKICYKPNTVPSQKEWEELEALMKQLLPVFASLMENAQGLNVKERHLCLLVRAGFKPSEMANLMGLDRSNVSMMRKRIYAKLFGRKGSGRNLDQMLRSFS